MNRNEDSSNRISAIKKSNILKDLIIFLIPVAIFLYYLHVYDPGIMTVDSYSQLHQIATKQYTNWHPFFHTLIEKACIKIYPSPISVCVLQILTFSTMWTIICRTFRSKDTGFDKTFILQVIITLAISLIPINAIYSITLWKDILFSYFLMFLCFMIYVLLTRKGNVSYIYAIILSVVMACVAQLRPNGVFIILITLLILVIYLYRNNKSQKLYILVPALTIILILLIASLNVAFDVEDNQKDAVFTKVSHMLADYDMNLDISKEDRTMIHYLIDENSIKSKYKPTYSDPIWGAANEQAFEYNKGTYIGMAIKYSLMNPGHFIQYILSSSPIVWDATRDAEWIGSVYKTDINNANRFFYSNNVTPASKFDGMMARHPGSPEYAYLNNFAYEIKDNLITDTLFDSPALYMYLAIILMIAIQFITKSKDIYIAYIPNLLNIILVLFSTPIQDNRYLYPNLLIAYMLIIILIGAYANRNTNPPTVTKIRDDADLPNDSRFYIEESSANEAPIESIKGGKISEKSYTHKQVPREPVRLEKETDNRYTHKEVPRENAKSEDTPDESSAPKEAPKEKAADKEVVDAKVPKNETPEEMEARIRAKILKELEMENNEQ